MPIGSFEIFENKVIIKLHDRICETADEVLMSELFKEIVHRCVQELVRRNSILTKIFGDLQVNAATLKLLNEALLALATLPSQYVPQHISGSEGFFKDKLLLNDFVEYLYNFWRNYERFIVCDASGDDTFKSSYQTFNLKIEKLTDLIRQVYRDIQEHITNSNQRIYRQTIAGAEVATISFPKKISFPKGHYGKLNDIPLIRQVLLYPPLILNPPMNKRTGKFERINKNPLDVVTVNEEDWSCYPAKVGPLLVLIYFHKKFLELGSSLCNLFKLAEDVDLTRKPDAVYLFGVPDNSLDNLASFPTVFYDDEANDILVGACPNRNEFGYFGYLKKMVLTLHNIKMMKAGKMPYHGAMVRIILKGNKAATILFIGDTGAGKSETLEVLRELAESEIQDIIIIADDMGSLDIDKQGHIIGYGTEIGAFLRLDDLQPGYALGQIDRAIIMSANQVNARIILPVTTYEILNKGYPLDFILYANNYEDIDEEHPILEQFTSVDQAIKVFKEGTVMSKGTTTTSGIVHSYYANIFGPPQYKDLHEPIAQKFFEAFFKKGIYVGQIRTRLGLSGWERKGPEEAAKDLLKTIHNF